MSNGDYSLEDKANLPKKTQGDEGMVEEHSLDAQIKYDQYQKGGQASRPPYGMRIGRMIPNGTVSPGASGPAQR